jgi:hypothetical protein
MSLEGLMNASLIPRDTFACSAVAGPHRRAATWFGAATPDQDLS